MNGSGGGRGGPGFPPSTFPGASPAPAAPGGSPHGNSSPSAPASGSAAARTARVARWWDDKDVARSLGIDSAQRHRMDAVFNSNRDALQARYNDLKRETAQQAKLTASSTPDERRVDAQIERVEQARAELAKAEAHLTLALRKELTPEQTAKLDSQ